ncbi:MULTISPECIES: hypothetical protein [unclassified Microcoleus]|uniref:hypothetical protein n=1 Tax=unclassified Microcoleus TaxID=2642155 RepID=UPI002FD3FE09
MNTKTSKSGKLMMGIAASAIASCALLSPQASFAQASGLTNAQPLRDFQTQDNTDPFSGRSSGSGIFDLIHRSNLGGGRSMEEFNSEQRKNLNDAAAEFRNKQRLLLEKQAVPSEGAIAPAEITAPVP